MEVLQAVAHPLAFGSAVQPATVEAAVHLQQHSLLERPLNGAAATVVLEAHRQQEKEVAAGMGPSSSIHAAGRHGAAAATDGEDELMGKKHLCFCSAAPTAPYIAAS